MKIFNWVHRRFYNRDEHYQNTINGIKKDEFGTTGTDKEALLGNNAALADMLDTTWRGGILTIGTFGLNPLMAHYSDEDRKDCDFLPTYKDMGEESDHQELEDYSLDGSADLQYFDSAEDENEGELDPLVYAAMTAMSDDHPLSSSSSSRTDDQTSNSDKKKKKERITLADLFSADLDEHAKPNHKKDQPSAELRKKPSPPPQGKNGLSFAKKLIPRVAKDPHPIRKLHHVMTRMLNRKIHPEPDFKIRKDSRVSSSVPGPISGQKENCDSVSLLHVRDAMSEL